MNCWDTIRSIGKYLADFLLVAAPVASAIIAVYVHRRTVLREQQLQTIRHLSKLRGKYPETIPKHRRLQYLRDMEFFCTGINAGIFDLTIVKKMSGRRLLRQYNSYMQNEIQIRRRNANHPEETWTEYELAMQKLHLMYICKSFRRRWFCRKYK